VVGLVEQSAGLSPGALFISPVCKFVFDDREGVGAYLRIPEKLDRIPGGSYDVF
jgi:hypothetical protein